MGVPAQGFSIPSGGEKMRDLRFLPVLFLAGALHASGVELVIHEAPYQATPGGEVTVSFSFERDDSIEEKRLVFLADVHRNSDGAKIHQHVFDNAGAGHADEAGELSAAFTLPGDASGPVHVNLWAVPWSVNRALVERFESYPTDGTYTYYWDINRRGDYGVTQDVYYLGRLVCPVYPGNTTYCSGVAFEAFILGWEDYNTAYGHDAITGLTANNVEAFRRVWYGVTDAEKLAARAIPEYGIGLEILDFEEFQKGDPIQLWRTGGSGHNPVFVNWARNTAGGIIGVRYWGSQGTSNGIGYRTEYFSGSGGTVRRDRFYGARARKPRDQADYDWAFHNVSTKLPAPTADVWILH